MSRSPDGIKYHSGCGITDKESIATGTPNANVVGCHISPTLAEQPMDRWHVRERVRHERWSASRRDARCAVRPCDYGTGAAWRMRRNHYYRAWDCRRIVGTRRRVEDAPSLGTARDGSCERFAPQQDAW